MSFWEHLDVLRGGMIRSLLVITLLSAIGLIFKEELFSVILAPSTSNFPVYKILGIEFSMELINVDLSAQFITHLKASIGAGFILAFPYVIWEVWRFIAPALYVHEKRAVRLSFLFSSGLFYLGAIVGYFIVFPFCLNFFMNYSVSPDIANTITLRSFMSMFGSLVLLMGITFEFPTIILVLTAIGVLNAPLLRKGRKYSFVILLVVAAFITPTGDPFTMIVLAAPLYLLYELSIFMASRIRREEEQ